MPSSARASSPLQALRRQVDGLQKRVDRLERMFEQEPKVPEPVGVATEAQRDWKRHDAMMRAWIDHDKQQALERYREDPALLRHVLESERKRFAYFRQRGITPPKSDLEEIARQLQIETGGAVPHE